VKRSPRRSTALLLACAGLALTPLAVSAQEATAPRANTEKLMLSLALGGASLSSDGLRDENQSGGGFSAQLGWGFTRLFTLLADASGAVLNQDDEEHVLVHFDLLGRFNFTNPGRAWVPFVDAGISARIAGQDDAVVVVDDETQTVDLEMSGGGLTVGGGLEYYLTPAIALGASVRWTVGEFSTVKFNNVDIDGFKLDATTTRLDLRVTWRPMRPR